MELNSIEQISGCFNNLPKNDLIFLNERKIQVSYLKGETIFKQGAFAPHVLFVNSGLAMVYLQLGKSKQINIHLAKQGDFIAFSSVFNKKTYQYSAISLSDSTFCMIEKEALKEVLIRNTDFSMQLTSKNNMNESRYIDIIKNLSYKQMRGKLASAILYLTSDELKDYNVFNFLTRQNIADFASITVESTVKFLKEFEKDGLIILKGKEIIIKNKQELKDIDLRG
ncbi:Crp/Fnr family transcriptional regulator [Lutibacter sp. TH_r2]|uniref:Crp/Fnr family transcriptional regulator n=1 Tax=Lutibacter sp. TH_r2 TaxID=3082083 RepID=UPI0029538B6D|nr:Crp/Fnr family transcriptional regulator [Lutibacter sp. TH_r2]MDV7186077.1 Crp/Fnr family transcriptional regulator [Lutibacter sp. TH_r2]